MKRFAWLLLVMTLSIIVIIGCTLDNTNDGPDGTPPDATEPEEPNDGNEVDAEPEEVTVTWGFQWGEGQFDQLYREKIEEALPHITIELDPIDDGVDVQAQEQMISAGNVPDILTLGQGNVLRHFNETGLAQDLDPFIEQRNYDIGRVDPNIIQNLRMYGGPEGELRGIPTHRRVYNLYYDKNIFDAFGVAFPEDGMTWNETFDLARDVTGTEGGQTYHGMDIMHPMTMMEQRREKHLDPDTDAPLVEQDPVFGRWFEKLDRLWSIPGVLPEENQRDYLHEWMNNFFGDQNIAMTIGWDNFLWGADVTDDSAMEWDVATLPVWSDEPTWGPGAVSWVLTMSVTSEKQDAVWEIFEYILSDEYQQWASENVARATVLTDADIQATLAVEEERLADKNLFSGFDLEPHPGYLPNEISEFHDINQFSQVGRDWVENRNEMDVSEQLRIWAEDLEQRIEDARIGVETQ